MNRKILTTLAVMLLGALTMSAYTVRFNVDHPNNVLVQANGGSGRTIDLGDGQNVSVDFEESENPLTVTPVSGAEITGVSLNDSPVNASPDGVYRMGITSNSMVTITTTGNGQGSDTRMVVFEGFVAQGDGIIGSPFTVTYNKDGEWVPTETDTWGMMQVPENSTVRVTPKSPYSLVSLSMSDGTVIDTQRLDDGSLTFTCDYNTYYFQRVSVNLSVDPSAIHFSISVDYAPNLTAALENQRQGAYQFLDLKEGKNDFVCLAENSPLEFFAADGAEIVSVMRNGEAASPIGNPDAPNWLFDLVDGDDFTVTTRGRLLDITLKAPEDNAPLQSYTYNATDGTVFTPTGMEANIQAHVGTTVYVKPRSGSNLTYITTSNGGRTDGLNYFQVTAGGDSSAPMVVNLYGTHADGVTINVDDASRVQVIQEGGRGDALTLVNGENQFNITDIKNALYVSATDGNQMVSVTQNGISLAPNSQGVYPVIAENGDFIDIASRKNPVDVSLSFSLNEGADISWFKASLNGDPIVLTNPMTVKSYSSLTLMAADGYELKSISSPTPGVIVENIPGTVRYAVTIPDADITSAVIEATIEEMSATEGNSIVIPNGDDTLIAFYEYALTDGEYKYVATLTNNTVNQVKNGNYVQIYCRDTQSRFRYIRVNGEDYDLSADPENRTVYIRIDSRTEIDAEIYTPCYAYTEATYDTERFIVSGDVFFLIDGEKQRSIYAEAGQTVKLVAEPSVGYIFDHFEVANDFSGTMVALEGDEYTFTQADLNINFIVFKGVFKVNPDEMPYTLRGQKGWVLNEYGEFDNSTSVAVGSVFFVLPNGEEVAEYTGIKGETVGLIVHASQEEAEKYKVDAYALMEGFPNSRLEGTTYTINPEDAGTDGSIWICAIVSEKGSGVDIITSDRAIGYNPATATLVAEEAIKVYDLTGRLVLSTESRVADASALPSGLYIAVSGNNRLKFRR